MGPGESLSVKRVEWAWSHWAVGAVDFKAGCVTSRRSGRTTCLNLPLLLAASDAGLVLVGCKWGCVQTGVLRKACDVGTVDEDEVRTETAALVVRASSGMNQKEKRSTRHGGGQIAYNNRAERARRGGWENEPGRVWGTSYLMDGCGFAPGGRVRERQR